MKKLKIILMIIMLPVLLLSQKETREFPGFIDKNQDGINDVFRDADGDGINDINNQPYEHDFIFIDENNDGINDNFQDADGDGVNDLSAEYIDRNGDGKNDNVIDHNGDWINDITGIIYNKRSSRGSRYGFVLEEIGQKVKNYVDSDGDGHFDDHPGKGSGRGRGFDKFVDEDGDGIADGKGFRKHEGFPWEDEAPGNRGQGKGKGKGHNRGRQKGRQ